MNKMRDLLSKTLVVGVIVLFIGMSVVSSNGNVIKSNHKYLGNQLCESGSNGKNDTTPPVTNISLEGNMSKFGFFSSYVKVTLNANDDQSGVNVTYYNLDGGNKEIYYEPFIVTGHCSNLIEYYSVDNAGNVEKRKWDDFVIDLEPPHIGLSWRRLHNNSIEFIPEENDDCTGNYKVEYYIEDEYMHTTYEEDNYKMVWIWTPPHPGYYVASAIIYDRAENTGWDDTGIYVPRTRVETYLIFQWFFERFPNMEVFLRIMNLLR